MIPWLWTWSPTLHFPWSGNVAQQIEPDTHWFFDAIAPASGNADVERKAFERASYGKQLGLVTDVLLEQVAHGRLESEAAKESLRRLKEIHVDIERIKNESVTTSVRSIEEDIARLKKRSPAEYKALLHRLDKA
jgi:hypothetical protein